MTKKKDPTQADQPTQAESPQGLIEEVTEQVQEVAQEVIPEPVIEEVQDQTPPASPVVNGIDELNKKIDQLAGLFENYIKGQTQPAIQPPAIPETIQPQEIKQDAPQTETPARSNRRIKLFRRNRSG